MPLDPDASQLIAVLRAVAAMPDGNTDPLAYREAARARRVPGDPGPIARVETFEIAGPASPIRLRFYDNAPGIGRPALVFYHGGGFVVGDLDSHDDLCRRLARESGWSVLAVDYRLAPEARYPAALDDAYAALLWAASPAAGSLGIAPSRLAVGGDSAGGNLAAAVALAARDRHGPKLCHQLLFYPVLELGFDSVSFLEPNPDYFLTADAMRWFWDQYLGAGADRSDQLAAPGAAADVSGLPAATIITAGYDPLRDEGERYATRLQEAGIDVVQRRFKGAFHGFVSMAPLISAQDAMALAAQRLRETASAY